VQADDVNARSVIGLRQKAGQFNRLDKEPIAQSLSVGISEKDRARQKTLPSAKNQMEATKAGVMPNGRPFLQTDPTTSKISVLPNEASNSFVMSVWTEDASKNSLNYWVLFAVQQGQYPVRW